MTNEDIRNGILARLEELEPDYDKYINHIEQGFTEPAFFVRLIDGAQEQGLGQRYTRSLMYNVMFFPDPDSLDEQTSCQTMADRLYEKLITIESNGVIHRGLRLKHEVVDNVLHFFVSYNIRLLAPKELVPKMEKIKQEEYIK
ncbi:phage tail terminator family protein [Paenibacillus periandrae]|uniref:phage tail terminator family protein n=1 Tax=Paenibacillus periandrae TaxID=1761741 RepID=UPI001F092790|nr:hypothetical protein [Paenibacillus periandrae]